MIDIRRENNNSIILSVDSEIFNQKIQTKVLYWLLDEFNIHWRKEQEISIISLNKKEGFISNSDFNNLYNKINQNFIDFKTRDIIISETKEVRNILLIKAFANNDDFEDYFLINKDFEK